MKSAIASLEIFAHREGEVVQRLSLVVGAPTAAGEGGLWICRVALANLHRAEEIEGRDSVEVLGLALARGRGWLLDLEADGFLLFRDREGQTPYRVA